MTWKEIAAIAVPAIALTLGASGGARADLITNGGFETTTGQPSGYSGQLGYHNFAATDWTATGYTFLYTADPGTTSGTHADNGGGAGNSGQVSMWGPGTGSNNGLTLSPNGGNFIAIDPVYQAPGSVSHSISGLTVGAEYAVNFSWAGAQQAGPNFNGATTELFHVSLGAETHDTPTAHNANHGFTGWMNSTLTFTATSAQEVLTFLADGGPSSALPPFVLLDGVSVVAAPEPSTWVFIVTGLLGPGAVKLYRRGKSASA